jgi:mono/diheme cytochrome c family protein
LIRGKELNPEGDKQNISRVLAYKLGGRAALPPPPPLRARAAPPPPFGDDVMVEEGRIHYARNCGVCHGAATISGGVLPDLRHSALLASEESWKAVVIDGLLAEKGMVSFAENLTAAEAEALRSYVVSRAHETQ